MLLHYRATNPGRKKNAGSSQSCGKPGFAAVNQHEGALQARLETLGGFNFIYKSESPMVGCRNRHAHRSIGVSPLGTWGESQ